MYIPGIGWKCYEEKKTQNRTEIVFPFGFNAVQDNMTFIFPFSSCFIVAALRPLRQNLPLTVSVLRDLTLAYLTRCVQAVHAFHIHICSSEVFNMCV